jgi:hypothetical protein
VSDPRGATDTKAGVVGQLRVPDWFREPVERAWREMPPIVRLFLGLALIDIVGRSLGLLAPRIDFGNTTLLAVLGSVLPHDLWIVLPALLFLRRPDAATATPWIFRGAIVLAGVEFLAQPLQGIIGYGSPGLATIATVIAFAASGVRLVAWLLMALGLAGLNPREPSPNVAALSNVVAVSVGISIAFGLVDVLTTSAADLGFFDAGLREVLTLNGLAGALALAAWAYFLWVVVRSVGDPRRPPESTTLAAAGAVLVGILGVFVALFFRILSAISPEELANPSGFTEVVSILGWVSTALGPSLIVVAFALGLAEPPLPYVPPVTTPSPPAPAEPERTEPAANEPAANASAAESAPFTAAPPAPFTAAPPAPGPAPAASPFRATDEPPDEEPAILPE